MVRREECYSTLFERVAISESESCCGPYICTLALVSSSLKLRAEGDEVELKVAVTSFFAETHTYLPFPGLAALWEGGGWSIRVGRGG